MIIHWKKAEIFTIFWQAVSSHRALQIARCFENGLAPGENSEAPNLNPNPDLLQIRLRLGLGLGAGHKEVKVPLRRCS